MIGKTDNWLLNIEIQFLKHCVSKGWESIYSVTLCLPVFKDLPPVAVDVWK